MFYVTTGNTFYYIYFVSNSGKKSVEEEEFFARYLSNQRPSLRMALSLAVYQHFAVSTS